VKFLVTVVAAAKLALPAWLAETVQVPADTSVKVVPLTVHTPAVVLAKDTAKLEEAVAVRAGGATPRV